MQVKLQLFNIIYIFDGWKLRAVISRPGIVVVVVYMKIILVLTLDNCQLQLNWLSRI